MANITTITGKRGTSYRVNWVTSAGRQTARTLPTVATAKRYRAWRELNPDAPHAEFAGPPADVGQPTSGTAPTVAAMYARLQSTRHVGRAQAKKQDEFFAGHLEPLQRVPVDALRPADVRRWLGRIQDGTRADGQPYAVSSVAFALKLLRSILRIAMEDGHLATNVADLVKPPRNTKRGLTQDDVLTRAELAAVLPHIADRYRALFAVLGYTGARLSEALGLTLAQVDLDAGTVTLGERVAEEVSNVIRVRWSGKSEAALRTVSLPAPAMAELTRHLAAYPPAPGAPIFTTRDGTTPLRSNLGGKVWKPARAAATIARPVPLRNLRHTAATHMLAAGLSPLEVAARLGHAQPTVTLNTYARFINDDDAATRVNALLAAYYTEAQS